MSNPEVPQDVPGAGLVPVTEQQTPLFELTPKHKEALEQMTVSYMQRSKIPFDATGLALGKEIVADALNRGMEANGLTGVDAKTNLRTLVKAGMDQRAQVVQGATRVYREYQNEVQYGNDRFIGPYALPAKQLTRVSREIRHSAASKLEESEKMNRTESQRRELLPRVAQAILSGLPKDQFPDVSIDMFPDASSQSKLVRNSIASVWLRGNPLPVIQITDLQQFTAGTTEPFDARVLAPLVEFVAEAGSQDPLAVADYLRDLGMQVGDMFQKARARFQANDITGDNTSPFTRDAVYAFFDKKLLLLHPALEERELIVDLARQAESDYSLWGHQWSVVIDGVRVPNEEILQRAQRIAIAQGRNGTRFQEGIREWKNMKATAERNEKRRAALEKLVSESSETLATAGIENMPASVFDIALDVNVAKAEVYKRERGIYREDRRILRRGDSNMKRMVELDEELRRENGGELPEEMVLPWSLSVEDSRRRRSTILLGTQRRVEYEATDTFMRDFFSQKVPVLDREEAYDFPVMDTPSIEWMIDKLRVEQDMVARHEGGIIPADVEIREVGKYIDRTIKNLEAELSFMNRHKLHNEEPLTGHERRRLDDFFGLKLSLADLMANAPTTMGIPKQFYEYSLSSRIEALERIIGARARREEVEGKDISQKKMKKDEFEMNVRVAKIEAPKIETPEEEAILFHHIHEWDGVHAISKDLRRFPFPERINSKEELIKWAQDMLTALPGLPLSFPRTAKDYAPSELQRMHRKHQIEALNKLIVIAQSPLFPSEELVKGLKPGILLSALSFRYGYMKARTQLEMHEQSYKKMHEEFLNIALDRYKLYLEQQYNRYAGQREEVTQRDPEKEFISSMRALNLALDESQDTQH